MDKFQAVLELVTVGAAHADSATDAVQAVGFLLTASISTNPAIVAAVDTYQEDATTMALEYLSWRFEQGQMPPWCKAVVPPSPDPLA
jgi:hypothetical protein